MPRKPSAELDSNPPVSLRLPPETRQKIVKLAETEHRSLSSQLVHLIEAALNQQQTSGGEASRA